MCGRGLFHACVCVGSRGVQFRITGLRLAGTCRWRRSSGGRGARVFSNGAGPEALSARDPGLLRLSPWCAPGERRDSASMQSLGYGSQRRAAADCSRTDGTASMEMMHQNFNFWRHVASFHAESSESNRKGLCNGSRRMLVMPGATGCAIAREITAARRFLAPTSGLPWARRCFAVPFF